MSKVIKKVAVLGSGVMGSRIACHFANIGAEVLLLDIIPGDLRKMEKESGKKEGTPAQRNSLVNAALKSAVKGRPAPLYFNKFQSRITTGNFDDNLHQIEDCDLVLEAIIEDLSIKNSLFEKVDKLRKEGSIIASNTSGIPLHMMTKGRSEDFVKNFLGMHFFNPPRYLKLLEIIPTPKTDKDVVSFLMGYGNKILGKTTVFCKDTPAFIANRIGLFALMKILELVEELGLTIEETDKLTGPASGKPKTGTFRLADLIGIDTTLKVQKGLYENLPEDEAHTLFGRKTALAKVAEKGWLGDKTRGGFYKKVKDESGNKKIMSLDLETLEYREKESPRLKSLGAIKGMDTLSEKLNTLYNFDDKGGELIRKSSLALFAYVSNRIPEVADDLYKIDDALRAGFGWDVGPFEIWDLLGAEKVFEDLKKEGIQTADWVSKMIKGGKGSFYKTENGNKYYYDIPSDSYKVIPGTEELIVLDYIRETNVIWSNSGCSIFDIGDGIINVEFRTKMNAIGSEVIEGLHKAMDLAEEKYQGIVIGNNATNFSAGANLALLLMMGVDQEWDEINFAIKVFQDVNMRLKYCGVPVVVAPHGLTLGGGCEITMHGDAAVAAAETYIGLVEVGVGLIPAGGGTKETCVRISDTMTTGGVDLNLLQESFLALGQGKVATSGHEAFNYRFLHKGDEVSINGDRQLVDAKFKALQMAKAGYKPLSPRSDIKVMGNTGLGLIYSGANAMFAAGYISEHDLKIAKKLTFTMCGGNLSGTQKVTEQYLLDLEREAFLSLMGEQKTLQRIEHTLKTGKPLRN